MANTYEAGLCGYNALAWHMATLGLQHIFGDIPIWSNIDISVPESDRDKKHIRFHGNRIHVMGTRHLYQCWIDVVLCETDAGHWQFNQMSVILRHPDSRLGCHHDLEPGVEVVTSFTSDQSYADSTIGPWVMLPAVTSHFTIPE